MYLATCTKAIALTNNTTTIYIKEQYISAYVLTISEALTTTHRLDSLSRYYSMGKDSV